MTQITEAPSYKQIIESLPAIPWILDWSTKSFTYVGPQIELLLGWPRESWRTAQDLAERIHPLDRDRVLDLYLDQPHVADDYDTEYSAITSSGQFVLIRDVVHIAHNVNGEIDTVMGFMIAVGLSRHHHI